MNDAELAIMAKIRLLFERSGTGDSFLSFNVGYPLTEDDLDFTAGKNDRTGGEELIALQKRADFSTLANQISEVDPIWTPRTGELSTIYRMIFDLGKVATVRPSSEDKEKLQAARAVLYTTRGVADADIGEDTTQVVNTPEYESYLEHEKAYFDTLEKLNEAKITVEHSSDAAEAGAPNEQAIGELERARADAWKRWNEQGYKNKIEGAIEDIRRLESRGPGLLWRDWITQFETATRENNPSTNHFFYPTTYVPANFVESDSWTRVTLDQSEIASLTERAREEAPELAESELVRTDIQSDLEIERLSVELARIKLLRPWFESEVPRSRIWKWQFDREPLSDGGDPPRGTLPAYMDSMVFARNLEIKLKAGNERNEAAVKHLQEGNLLSFGPIILNQIASTAEPRQVTELRTASFDPEETLALQEITREVVARPITARTDEPIKVATEVENADIIARSPALADLATIIAGTNVRTEPGSGTPQGSKGTDRGLLRANLELQPTLLTERTTSDSGSGNQSSTEARRAQPAVRDHRSTTRAKPAQPAVRDHRTGRSARPARSVVRDHRSPTPARPGGRPVVVTPVPRPRPSPAGGFVGRVLEQRSGGSDRPIEDARIRFEREEDTLRKTVLSDVRGRYRVELPRGRYTISSRRSGYNNFPPADSDEGLVTLPGNEFETFDISMEKQTAEQTEVDAWETIQLIGFICKKLPKAPNPAPELTWD